MHDGEEVKILRDNMPFGAVGQGEYGTYFIGYAKSPDPIEEMLTNMFVGRPEGNYDRLLDFSRAVTGSLFFVPSGPLLEGLANDDLPPDTTPAGDALSSAGADQSDGEPGSLGIGGLR